MWYGGSGTPLSSEQAQTLISRIAALNPDNPRGSELSDALRTFAEGDDGDEVYVVNLLRFRDKAVYPPGHDYDDDARAAWDRYTGTVLSDALTRGIVPVLLGNTVVSFPNSEGISGWDHIAIARYRSRRDMLETFIHLNESGNLLHKTASIESTFIFVVDSTFSFAFVRGTVAVFFVALGVVSHLLVRRFQRRG